jgi:P-type Ca2+ transporter type 2C
MTTYNIPKHFKGISEQELTRSRQKFGYNKTDVQGSGGYFALLEILKEPMLLLLIAVTVVYAITGHYSESLFMLGAIVVVSGISYYQDNRSKKALEALEKLNAPLSTVIRNSKVLQIPTHEIAVGDLCAIEEGKMINADGIIVYSNDFSVNESSLTGESLSVYKSQETKDNVVYSGTFAVSGFAIFQVESIGNETQIGKIGKSIQEIIEERSPLHNQIRKFVKGMAIIGMAVFFYRMDL